MITHKVKNLIAALLPILIVVSMFLGNLPNAHAQQSDLGWKDPVNLSNSGSSTSPSLVVDSKGVIHVAWIDKYDGYKYVESKDGQTWSLPTIVKFPFSPKEDSLPTLIADGEGTIHVFWRDKENALYYSQAKSETFGNPANWSKPLKLSSSVADFKAVIDQQGGVHVSYIKSLSKDNNLPGVYYTQLVGLSWSASVNLYPSQYFRSIDPKDAHVRIAVSGDSKINNVYVAWDDPAKKRIFMAKSADGGLHWDNAYEVVGPDPNLGYSTPYHVEINTFNDAVLVTWQVGTAGVRCTQFSQSSIDGGKDWDKTTKIFNDLPTCPEVGEFIGVDKDYAIMMLNIQDSLSITAWNGVEWGAVKIQNEFATFSNPATFDPILFRCQQTAFYNGSLFAVGCDEGSSGDIWFTSRSLGSLENWFPPASAWSVPTVLVSAPEKMSDLVSVADGANRIHTIWVQSALSEKDNYKPSIQYIRWDGTKWSKPISIITDLTGVPAQLTLAIDNQGRLLLSWVDQSNGELWFSWANSERANIPLEWSQSNALPVPSKLVRSPNILVDSTGNIVVAYAVYVNEYRGIYITRSSDLGATWSSPSLAFDALSAGWELVDQPKLSLTADGALHLLFTQYSALNLSYVPVGLYYSRSFDGGATWSESELVDENPVLWNEIISDGQSLHRLWQVREEAAISFYHQFSTDGGATWENKSEVSSASAKDVQVSFAMNANGNLHFTQLVDNEILNIQDWKWNNQLWDPQETKVINTLDYTDLLAARSVITTDGHLSVFFVSKNKNSEYSLVNAERVLDSLDTSRTLPQAVIPVATPFIAPTATPNIDLAPTVVVSPLTDLNNAPSSSKKNIVGISLVAIVVIILALTVRRKPSSS